jgi:hypothetical protein
MLNCILSAVVLLGQFAGSDDQAAAGQAQSSTPPEYRRYPQGYKPAAGGAYINIGLPNAISGRDLSTFADLLAFSNEQQHALAPIYEKYREDDWEFRKKNVQCLWDESATLAKAGNAQTDIGASRHLADLFDRRDRVIRGLIRLEDDFFAKLQTILTDQQLNLLPRVRNLRIRTRCSASHEMFPGAMFDLEDFILTIRRQGADVTPRDPDGLDIVLLAYSTEITPMFKSRAELAQRQQGEVAVVYASGYQAAAEGRRDDARALQERLFSLQRRVVAAARKIHEKNREYAELIQAQLPESTARVFANEVQQQLYRGLFPNPFDLSRVLEAVNSLTDIRSEQRLEINRACDFFAMTNSALFSQMKDEYLAWSESVAIRHGYGFEPYEVYSTRMRNLRKQIQQAAEFVITTLRDQLAESQWAQVAGAVHMYEETAQSYVAKQTELALKNRAWPLPYD